MYVHNKSAVPFITGDQPAINARWKETDEIGNIVALEIYYPISPTSALVLEFTPGKVFCDTYVDEVFVRERNGLIREEAGLYVFANEKEVIREVLGLIGD